MSADSEFLSVSDRLYVAAAIVLVVFIAFAAGFVDLLFTFVWVVAAAVSLWLFWRGVRALERLASAHERVAGTREAALERERERERTVSDDAVGDDDDVGEEDAADD